MNNSKVRIDISITLPDKDEHLSLVGQEFVFGRSPNSNVHVNDPWFSRSHFKIFLQEGSLWVCDLGSSNGTYLNDEKIESDVASALGENDVISIPNSSTETKILKITVTESNSGKSEHETTIVDRLKIPLKSSSEDEDDDGDQKTKGGMDLSDLSQQIVAAAHQKVDHLIQSANEKAHEILETVNKEAERKRAEAVKATEKLIAEKQKKAEMDIEVFKKENKGKIQKEHDLEKQKKTEELKNLFNTDKTKMLKKLEDEMKIVTADHEKKKKDLVAALKKFEDQIAGKKVEYDKLESLFDQKLKKANEELDQKLSKKKAEIEKLEESFAEEKKKHREKIEKDAEDRHAELEKILADHQTALKLKHEELDLEEDRLKAEILKKVEASDAEFEILYKEAAQKAEMKEQRLAKELEAYEAEIKRKQSHLDSDADEYKVKLQKTIDEYEKRIDAKQLAVEALEIEYQNDKVRLQDQLEKDVLDRKTELQFALKDVENKIESKKKEIAKLDAAHESQKSKQFQLLEAQVENKRFELEEQLVESEAKVAAVQKEFASLFDHYETKKSEQAHALETMKKTKEQTLLELKQLESQLVQHKKSHQDQLESDRAMLETLHAEIDKFKKTKNDLEVISNRMSQEYGERQAVLEELKKQNSAEETQLKQKKTSYQTIEAEINKLSAQKEAIIPKINELNNELSVLMKKVEAAAATSHNIQAQHNKEVEGLKTAFLQNKAHLEEEMRKLKEVEEKRLQNLTRQELNHINKLKEESLRLVLDLEDSITKEISNSTSKVFANTIGIEKFREIAPNYEKSIKASLQSGVLKLLQNELTATDDKKGKTLSSKQTNWKPISVAVAISFVIFGVLPQIYRQVKDQNDPIRRQLEEQARAAAVKPVKKFTPTKVATLGTTFVQSVIYTEDFCETYAQENFRSELMKKGSTYLYKQWQIDEEKSIQSYAMIFSMIDLLKEKTAKIDPDNEKKDIGKMETIEKETMKKLEKILGNEVRLEAALKFQTRFYHEYVAQRGLASGPKDNKDENKDGKDTAVE
jgi:pSer/pThr/pTyr-binding forkhead associated (FHA) protein